MNCMNRMNYRSCKIIRVLSKSSRFFWISDGLIYLYRVYKRDFSSFANESKYVG